MGTAPMRAPPYRVCGALGLPASPLSFSVGEAARNRGAAGCSTMNVFGSIPWEFHSRATTTAGCSPKDSAVARAEAEKATALRADARMRLFMAYSYQIALVLQRLTLAAARRYAVSVAGRRISIETQRPALSTASK